MPMFLPGSASHAMPAVSHVDSGEITALVARIAPSTYCRIDAWLSVQLGSSTTIVPPAKTVVRYV